MDAQKNRMADTLMEQDKVIADAQSEIARLTKERDEARVAGVLVGLAQARDICKRVRNREDLTEDERCGVLEGALAIQDEIARIDQRKEERT